MYKTLLEGIADCNVRLNQEETTVAVGTIATVVARTFEYQHLNRTKSSNFYRSLTFSINYTGF